MSSKMSILFNLILAVVLVWMCNPAFALEPASVDLAHLSEIHSLEAKGCLATASVPSNERVLYRCSNGEEMWSDVFLITQTETRGVTKESLEDTLLSTGMALSLFNNSLR